MNAVIITCQFQAVMAYNSQIWFELINPWAFYKTLKKCTINYNTMRSVRMYFFQFNNAYTAI